jgi:outer membrane phospholipase A
VSIAMLAALLASAAVFPLALADGPEPESKRDAEGKEAEEQPAEPWPGAEDAEDSGAEPVTPADPVQRFQSNFSSNEPFYIAVGSRDDTTAKFQISFKYRFLSKGGGIDRRTGLSSRLFLGYTQKSIWDLDQKSLPFRDTNYRPSFFYLRETPLGCNGSRKRCRSGLQIGVEHESNGQGGDDSRSLNVAFVRPTWRLGDLDDYHWTLSPKFYGYVTSLSDNRDLPDYRGYVDFLVSLGKLDSWKFAGTFRKGTDASAYSAEIEITYPLDRIFGGNVATFLYLQVFSGYGESLIDYDRKGPTQIRLGIAALR